MKGDLTLQTELQIREYQKIQMPCGTSGQAELRITVKSASQTPKTEQFTIRFANTTKTGADLPKLWIDVLLTVPVAL